MRRDTLWAVGLWGLTAVLVPARVLLGIEIAPASARDIMRALGPDASGLHISQDTLPDLFALTASRIEEDPKQFTVEQPYLSGRWKGGKAVIEYARDLSYTLVSVYDKNGRRQRIYSVRTQFNDQVARQEAQTTGAEPATTAGEERPAPPPAGSARSEAASSPSANVNFEWDEVKGVYVPVTTAAPSSAMEEAAAPTQAAKSAAASETTTTHRRRRHHRGDDTAVASANTFTPAPAKKSSLPAPMQDSGIWLPSTQKTKASPSAARAVVKAGNSTWVEHREDNAAPESTPRKRRHKHVEPETMVAKAPAAETTKASDEWVPKSIQEKPAKPKREEVAKRPVEGEVPSTEELLGTSAPPPSQAASSVAAPTEKPSRRHRTKAAAAEQAAPVQQAPSPAVPSAPEPTRVASAPDTPTGPDTADSDKWVPKANVPQPAKEPEIPPEPMKVAMVPKSAPVDNSVDNLLKMANAGKEEAPKEGDTWVPKNTATANPEAEINKELARVRQEEAKKKEAPKPVVQIRRDVNNPEEGVLPVSSFEKFSGPMYGRHREYERRFYPGKKTKAKAPDHDFYVDEVDRKKEIHNIYYYTHQKGKAPRLVAVERHDKVSFMGNYDIEKEDKGKISTYN